MLLDMLNAKAKQKIRKDSASIRYTRFEGNCPFCSKEIKHSEFKDKLSLLEFGISGLCQECQDKTFAEPVDFVDEEPKQCNDGCRNGTLHRDKYYCCGKCR